MLLDSLVKYTKFIIGSKLSDRNLIQGCNCICWLSKPDLLFVLEVSRRNLIHGAIRFVGELNFLSAYNKDFYDNNFLNA